MGENNTLRTYSIKIAGDLSDLDKALKESKKKLKDALDGVDVGEGIRGQIEQLSDKVDDMTKKLESSVKTINNSIKKVNTNTTKEVKTIQENINKTIGSLQTGIYNLTGSIELLNKSGGLDKLEGGIKGTMDGIKASLDEVTTGFSSLQKFIQDFRVGAIQQPDPIAGIKKNTKNVKKALEEQGKVINDVTRKKATTQDKNDLERLLNNYVKERENISKIMEGTADTDVAAFEKLQGLLTKILSLVDKIDEESTNKVLAYPTFDTINLDTIRKQAKTITNTISQAYSDARKEVSGETPDIYLRWKTEINPDETAEDIYNKIEEKYTKPIQEKLDRKKLKLGVEPDRVNMNSQIRDLVKTTNEDLKKPNAPKIRIQTGLQDIDKSEIEATSKQFQSALNVSGDVTTNIKGGTVTVDNKNLATESTLGQIRDVLVGWQSSGVLGGQNKGGTTTPSANAGVLAQVENARNQIKAGRHIKFSKASDQLLKDRNDWLEQEQYVRDMLSRYTKLQNKIKKIRKNEERSKWDELINKEIEASDLWKDVIKVGDKEFAQWSGLSKGEQVLIEDFRTKLREEIFDTEKDTFNNTIKQIRAKLRSKVENLGLIGVELDDKGKVVGKSKTEFSRSQVYANANKQVNALQEEILSSGFETEYETYNLLVQRRDIIQQIVEISKKNPDDERLVVLGEELKMMTLQINNQEKFNKLVEERNTIEKKRRTSKNGISNDEFKRLGQIESDLDNMFSQIAPDIIQYANDQMDAAEEAVKYQNEVVKDFKNKFHKKANQIYGSFSKEHEQYVTDRWKDKTGQTKERRVYVGIESDEDYEKKLQEFKDLSKEFAILEKSITRINEKGEKEYDYSALLDSEKERYTTLFNMIPALGRELNVYRQINDKVADLTHDEKKLAKVTKDTSNELSDILQPIRSLTSGQDVKGNKVGLSEHEAIKQLSDSDLETMLSSLNNVVAQNVKDSDKDLIKLGKQYINERVAFLENYIGEINKKIANVELAGKQVPDSLLAKKTQAENDLNALESFRRESQERRKIYGTLKDEVKLGNDKINQLKTILRLLGKIATEGTVIDYNSEIVNRKTKKGDRDIEIKKRKANAKIGESSTTIAGYVGQIKDVFGISDEKWGQLDKNGSKEDLARTVLSQINDGKIVQNIVDLIADGISDVDKQKVSSLIEELFINEMTGVVGYNTIKNVASTKGAITAQNELAKTYVNTITAELERRRKAAEKQAEKGETRKQEGITPVAKWVGDKDEPASMKLKNVSDESRVQHSSIEEVEKLIENEQIAIAENKKELENIETELGNIVVESAKKDIDNRIVNARTVYDSEIERLEKLKKEKLDELERQRDILKDVETHPEKYVKNQSKYANTIAAQRSNFNTFEYKTKSEISYIDDTIGYLNEYKSNTRTKSEKNRLIGDKKMFDQYKLFIDTMNELNEIMDEPKRIFDETVKPIENKIADLKNKINESERLLNSANVNEKGYMSIKNDEGEYVKTVKHVKDVFDEWESDKKELENLNLELEKTIASYNKKYKSDKYKKSQRKKLDSIASKADKKLGYTYNREPGTDDYMELVASSKMLPIQQEFLSIYEKKNEEYKKTLNEFGRNNEQTKVMAQELLEARNMYIDSVLQYFAHGGEISFIDKKFFSIMKDTNEDNLLNKTDRQVELENRQSQLKGDKSQHEMQLSLLKQEQKELAEHQTYLTQLKEITGLADEVLSDEYKYATTAKSKRKKNDSTVFSYTKDNRVDKDMSDAQKMASFAVDRALQKANEFYEQREMLLQNVKTSEELRGKEGVDEEKLNETIEHANNAITGTVESMKIYVEALQFAQEEAEKLGLKISKSTGRAILDESKKDTLISDRNWYADIASVFASDETKNNVDKLTDEVINEVIAQKLKQTKTEAKEMRQKEVDARIEKYLVGMTDEEKALHKELSDANGKLIEMYRNKTKYTNDEINEQKAVIEEIKNRVKASSRLELGGKGNLKYVMLKGEFKPKDGDTTTTSSSIDPTLPATEKTLVEIKDILVSKFNGSPSSESGNSKKGGSGGNKDRALIDFSKMTDELWDEFYKIAESGKIKVSTSKNGKKYISNKDDALTVRKEFLKLHPELAKTSSANKDTTKAAEENKKATEAATKATKDATDAKKDEKKETEKATKAAKDSKKATEDKTKSTKDATTTDKESKKATEEKAKTEKKATETKKKSSSKAKSDEDKKKEEDESKFLEKYYKKAESLGVLKKNADGSKFVDVADRGKVYLAMEKDKPGSSGRSKEQLDAYRKAIEKTTQAEKELTKEEQKDTTPATKKKTKAKKDQADATKEVVKEQKKENEEEQKDTTVVSTNESKQTDKSKSKKEQSSNQTTTALSDQDKANEKVAESAKQATAATNELIKLNEVELKIAKDLESIEIKDGMVSKEDKKIIDREKKGKIIEEKNKFVEGHEKLLNESMNYLDVDSLSKVLDKRKELYDYIKSEKMSAEEALDQFRNIIEEEKKVSEEIRKIEEEKERKISEERNKFNAGAYKLLDKAFKSKDVDSYFKLLDKERKLYDPIESGEMSAEEALNQLRKVVESSNQTTTALSDQDKANEEVAESAKQATAALEQQAEKTNAQKNTKLNMSLYDSLGGPKDINILKSKKEIESELVNAYRMVDEIRSKYAKPDYTEDGIGEIIDLTNSSVDNIEKDFIRLEHIFDFIDSALDKLSISEEDFIEKVLSNKTNIKKFSTDPTYLEMFNDHFGIERAMFYGEEGIPTNFEEIESTVEKAVDQFTEPLKDGKKEIQNAAKEDAKAVPEEFEKELKINSPSRVMYELGLWTGRGFENGLLDSLDDIKKTIIEKLKVGAISEDDLKLLSDKDAWANDEEFLKVKKKPTSTKAFRVMSGIDTTGFYDIAQKELEQEKYSNIFDKMLFDKNNNIKSVTSIRSFINKNMNDVLSAIDYYKTSIESATGKVPSIEDIVNYIFGEKGADTKKADKVVSVFDDLVNNAISKFETNMKKLQKLRVKNMMGKATESDIIEIKNLKAENDTYKNYIGQSEIDNITEKYENYGEVLSEETKEQFEFLNLLETTDEELKKQIQLLNDSKSALKNDVDNDVLIGKDQLKNLQTKAATLYKLTQSPTQFVGGGLTPKDSESVANMLRNMQGIRKESVIIANDGRNIVGTIEKAKGQLQTIEYKWNDILGVYTQSTKVLTSQLSIWDRLKGQIKKSWTYLKSYLGGYLSAMRLISTIRQGISYVRELDKALTEMKKVSDETTASLKNFQKQSFKTASEIGSTAAQIQNSAADFMRLGYSLNDAAELAKHASVYANVGDMDISTATEHMISSIQAWQSEFSSATEASMALIDKYNKIGNNYAITSADIGSAMERSAAALKTAGNTVDESIGLITAGNLIQQDADTTANALKVMSLRIRGSKADLEDMGEETDDLATSTSKLRNEIKALTGVDIMLDEKTYKSTAKIIQEIGKNWDRLDDVSKATTLEKLAGKTRASTVAGLIENYKTIGEVARDAADSEGSAFEENAKYIDSVEGKIQQLTNSVQEFWSSAIDSETLKSLISGLTNILNLATKLSSDSLLTSVSALFGLSKSAFKNYEFMPFRVYNKKDDEGIEYKKFGTFIGARRQEKDSLFNEIKEQEKLTKSGNEAIKEYYSLIDNGTSKEDALSKAFKNTNSSVKQYVDGVDNADEALNSFNNAQKASIASLKQSSQQLSFSARAMNAFKNVAATALNVFTGFVVANIVSGLISVISDIVNLESRIADAANDAANKIENTSNSIDDYKDKINELKKVINDSESSEEQVIQARRDLISVQEEVIKQFKKEADAADIVSESINKQTDALDKLKAKTYQLAENEFTKAPWWEDFWLWLNGNDSRLDKMEKDYLSERTVSYKFGYADEMTDDLIKDMQELGAEFLVYEKIGNNLRKATANDNIVDLIKSSDDQIDVELAITGNAEEVYDRILKLQTLVGDTEGLKDLENELRDLAEEYGKLDDEYADFAKQYVINRKIMNNDEYAESYLDIMNKREAYIEAYSTGDKEKIEQATRDFMKARQDAIIKSGDNYIVQRFFTNMFTDEMANAIKDVNFKDKLSSDALFKKLLPYLGDDFKSSYKQYQDYIEDGLEYTDSKVKEELDHLQSLVQDFYDSLSKEDIIKVEALDGYEEQVLDAMDKINLDLAKGTGDALDDYINKVANEFNIDDDSVRAIFNAYSDALTVAGKNANPEEFIQAFMDGASSFDMDTDTLLSIAGQVVNYALEDVSKEDINKAVKEASSKIGITSTEFNNTYSASINGVFALIDAIKESGYDVETALELIGIKSKEDIDLQNELTKAIAQNIKNTKDRITSLYETLEKINSGDLTSDELIDFLSDEDNAKFLKSVDNLGNAIGDEIRSQLDEAKKLIGDASPELIDALEKSAEKAKFSTHLSKINEDIDKLQEGMKTLSSAFEEYNENGFITLDTFQSLMADNGEYIQMLTIENGQLKINEDAYKAQIAVKLNDYKAILDQAAATEIQALAEAKANGKTEESIGLLNAETIALGVNTKAQIARAKEVGVSDAEINAIINKYDNLWNTVSDSYMNNFKEFSGATTSSASDAADKLKEELDNYIAYQDALLDAGKISYDEYTKNVRGKLDNLYSSGKLTAKDYFDYVQKLLEKQLSIYDEVLSAVARRYDKEIESIDKQIDAINEENDALNKQKDEYDKILSVVQEVYDKEIESLQDQQQAIQDKIDALQKANDEEDRALALANARYALEKAQQQRTRLVYSGAEGFVYKTDPEAIRDAKKELKDAELENTVAALEDEKGALDKTIETLEEYKEKWSDISEVYDKEVNRQLAIALWGENYEQMILQNREQDIQDFTNKYVDLQKKVDDNTSLIESFEEKKKYYEELKAQWQEITDIYKNSIEDQHTAMVLGADWENEILSGRTTALEKFKNEYIAIQEQIKQAAIDSANAQAAADKGGSGGGNSFSMNNSSFGSKSKKTYYVIDKDGNMLDENGNVVDSKNYNTKYYNTREEAELSAKTIASRNPRVIGKVFEADINGFKIYRKKDNGDVVAYGGNKTFDSYDDALKALNDPNSEYKKKLDDGWKFVIQAFAKGGVINANNNNPLNSIASKLGEDTAVLARHGERILTPVQNQYWEKWTNAIPNLTKHLEQLKFNTPNLSSILNAVASKETTVKQEISISLPNVTNTSGAEYVLNALKTLPLEAVQRVNRR